MSKLRLLLSVCLSSTLVFLAGINTVRAQVPLVTVPTLKSEELRQRGLQLAQQAIRLAQIGQLEEAESLAELAVQLSGDNFQTHTVLGGIYLQANKTEPALGSLKRAVELAPDNPRVYFNLGLAYNSSKSFPAAADVLEQGLKLDPKAKGEYFNLGNTYIQMGRAEDALKSFQTAVELDSEFWQAINNIGLLRYEQGQIDEAKRQWQKAIEAGDKTDTAEPKLALGVAVYVQGDQQKGLSLSEEALKLDRQYANLTYLKEQLWGNKLLGDTSTVLSTPQIKAVLDSIPEPKSEAGTTTGSKP
ncbi:MAG: tetratricopeptide repeat protein [Gemmatimonadaceae bacterium]|nr:tetratricopeptide repeat protein [Gloeobacterales cyanobacterium ES-bin-141]